MQVLLPRVTVTCSSITCCVCMLRVFYFHYDETSSPLARMYHTSRFVLTLSVILFFSPLQLHENISWRQFIGEN